ncbi:flavin monoamine oxidase family protein [Mesorhizobium sp. J8]|uniref:flavin monoamine oxidase family protein n=1 Tax=Mesorhizobium sp. J8 TaxID=2777475 RepID=UPI001914DE43|nr:FAD-dependent oxidoreductase [Mesorhizobium sp. J8]BCM17790.1 FAD-dependent oxidoreductase [Mesorhizobium sp. J8]
MNHSTSQTILIVGAGLAGLTAAYRLHRAGCDFAVIEARDRLGGRIFTADPEGEASVDGFDLGPSWFWPDMHPAISQLARELELEFFPQHTDGAMLFQRSRETEPERYRTMRQEPPSMRLVGGSGSIICALAARLPQGRIRLGMKVTRVERTGGGVKVRFNLANGTFEEIEAGHVIFALPPRLLAETVEFDPAPDGSFQRLWRDTPTWMAPHAKFFALYNTPFWRAAGFSGAAQSLAGPLVEIHDATTASGKAALFGFIGVPAPYRRQAGRDAVIGAAVAQLGQLFGPGALKPTATLYKDWAADPLTATSLDQAASGHPTGGRREWVDGDWREWITLAGSETAARDPGYLAGAVEAGERAADSLVNRQKGKVSFPLLNEGAQTP